MTKQQEAVIAAPAPASPSDLFAGNAAFNLGYAKGHEDARTASPAALTDAAQIHTKEQVLWWANALKAEKQVGAINGALVIQMLESYAALLTASSADQGEWQPIETAPKDGAVIDLWVGDHRRTSCFWGLPHHCCGEMGSYCDSEWHDLVDGWIDDMNEPLSEFASPTHWMPLPPAPAMSASEEGNENG